MQNIGPVGQDERKINFSTCESQYKNLLAHGTLVSYTASTVFNVTATVTPQPLADCKSIQHQTPHLKCFPGLPSRQKKMLPWLGGR